MESDCKTERRNRSPDQAGAENERRSVEVSSVQTQRPRFFGIILVGMLVLMAACAPAATPAPSAPASTTGSGAPAAQPAPPAARKHLVAALLKPNVASMRENGSDRTYEFILGGLGRLDTWGNVHAQLAEAVPTIENGLWKVLPDGRMETTWKIRADAKWHDGVPITSADYLFGTAVASDKDLGEAVDGNFASVEAIEALDPQTVVIKWNKTYVFADAFPTGLGTGLFHLLPRHLLQSSYEANKASFYSLPYWSSGMVHAGAYKVKEWIPDSHVLLEANDAYVLGRPKIDTVEIRFIPDTNTLIANLLAGSVHMTLGQSISPEQTANLKNTWREGTGVTSPVFGSAVGIFFQHINPDPAVMSDVRFRRALFHSFDRQALIDTVLAGQTKPAHALVGGLHPGADEAAVKYDFDLRRASQYMEELGFRKGSDGMWQDAQGRGLSMEVRGVLEEEVRQKTTFASEGDWHAFGINTNLVMLPATGVDVAYQSTWPATRTAGIAGGLVAGLFNYFSVSRVRTAENNYVGGSGPRYVNAELDGLINRVMATIPRPEREQLIEQTVRHMTDNAITIGVFYQPYNAATNNRLVNVTTSSTFAHGWDAHLWDLR
jgi:peptide/nickel transport system substrate-binding protein